MVKILIKLLALTVVIGTLNRVTYASSLFETYLREKNGDHPRVGA